MIRPYQQGDKHYKVKRTKDGRFEVYDSAKNFGDEGYIAAIFDANEEQDAFEAAENLNMQNDETNASTLKFFANLSKELHSNLKESCMQYMDALIEENLRDWFKPHTDKRTGKKIQRLDQLQNRWALLIKKQRQQVSCMQTNTSAVQENQRQDAQENQLKKS